MGQYYVAVNLDKKEYIRPHACGDGAKLMEFGLSSMATMSCLAILLADGNGRGGGDLYAGKCPSCKGRGSFGDFMKKTYRICKDCGGSGCSPAPPIVGSWAGDRIVITGDYADRGKFVPKGPHRVDDKTGDERNLYSLIYAEDAGYKDVSLEAMRALAGDGYVRQRFEKQVEKDSWMREQLEPVLAE